MIYKFVFLVIGVFLLTYVILFTRNAPDFYVLIKYYIDKEYLTGPLYKSVLDNTVITDILCLISDNLDDASIKTFGVLLLMTYIITFIFKYTYLFSVSDSIEPIFWLFIASFFAFDCNQMRYSLSIILLVISINTKSYLILILSILSHITSLGFKIVSVDSKWIYLGALFIPVIVGIFMDSRFASYMSGEGFVFFKSYLLFIPIVLYNYYSNKDLPLNIFIKNLSLRLLIISPLSIIIFPLVTARLIETIFILLFYGNIFSEVHKNVKVSMYFFALILLLNRLLNSSIGENNFIDSYDYSIW